MPEHAHVYILASGFKHLYIGVTTHLERRIAAHKTRTDPNSFTARYNITTLVYVERFDQITTAIAREKQLKHWSRIKKLRLIISANPSWQDLSADWGKPHILPPHPPTSTTARPLDQSRPTTTAPRHLDRSRPTTAPRHLDRSRPARDGAAERPL